jgi:serine/threonine protein kinase
MRDAPIMAPPRSTAQTDCLNQGGDNEQAQALRHADVAANPVRLERFQREAKTVASLNHPQIVTLYSVEPRSRSSRRSPSRCSA